MRSIDDPAHLTPNQRLTEVASILAVGVLRLRSRLALPGEAPENPANSAPSGLEVSGETVLSVHNG